MDIGNNLAELGSIMYVEIEADTVDPNRTLIVDLFDPDTVSPNNTASLSGKVVIYGETIVTNTGGSAVDR